LTFVPVDFETQTLASVLASSGFDFRQPAVFSWLGVTMYLTRDALFTTLRLIAALPIGSAVVFDYAISPSALGWFDRFIHWSMARRVAKVGEPWKTFFRPKELEAELRALGFNRIIDAGPAQLNRLYCENRADGLKIRALGHLMNAGRRLEALPDLRFEI